MNDKNWFWRSGRHSQAQGLNTAVETAEDSLNHTEIWINSTQPDQVESDFVDTATPLEDTVSQLETADLLEADKDNGGSAADRDKDAYEDEHTDLWIESPEPFLVEPDPFLGEDEDWAIENSEAQEVTEIWEESNFLDSEVGVTTTTAPDSEIMITEAETENATVKPLISQADPIDNAPEPALAAGVFQQINPTGAAFSAFSDEDEDEDIDHTELWDIAANSDQTLEDPLLLWLIVREPKAQRGTILSISPKSVMGRSKSVDVRWHDPRMSRRHARFTLERDPDQPEDEQFYYFIWPLEASNEIILNGRPLRQATKLRENDIIKMGDTSFIVKIME